jgi:hypothetical protein
VPSEMSVSVSSHAEQRAGKIRREEATYQGSIEEGIVGCWEIWLGHHE